MSDLMILTLLGGSALISAIIAGVFLTFSDFAMRAFTVSSDPSGAEVMQVLNRVIYRSIFMVILLCMIPVSAGLGVLAMIRLEGAAASSVLLGTGLYWVGMFMVTVLGNVPMNNRLDALSLNGGEAVTYWQTYRVNWTRLNHIRSLATITTAMCYGAAALYFALSM